MSRATNSRHQAALSIEELFLQPSQPSQQWLLTYLDVFVLIIMLVISLIAVSDLGTEEKTKKTPGLQNHLKKTTQQQTQNTKKSNKDTSSDTLKIKRTKDTPENLIPDGQRILKEEKNKLPVINDISSDLMTENQPNKIQENKQSDEHEIQPQINLPTQQVQEPSKKVKDTSTIVEYQNKDAYKEDKPKQENQLSDDILQKQLKKTVDQLGLTDSVDLKVTLGYAQLEIQDKILFKSSEAALLKAGESLLTKLTPLLAQSSGLIYIEGHTDNRPIKTTQFPSNWELGAARATRVLHFLASQNLESSRLRAITYGDTKPIADNSTKEGREKNRRVSLVIKISDKID